MCLKIKVENEFVNLERELQIILLLNKKHDINQLDEIEIRGASLSLTALYNGMERVLSDILKSKGLVFKNEESWHRLILDKAIKSNLISKEVLVELKGFLAFRHFVRHAYSFEIEPETIKVIIKKAPNIIKQFIEEIREILQ